MIKSRAIKQWGFALLLLVTAISLIQSSSRADFSPNARVPSGTTTGQTIHWSSTANGGFGGWVIDGSFVSNGSQAAVGGSVDTTTRLSVNPQGSTENGLTINSPNAGTGFPFQVLSNGSNLLTVLPNGHMIVGGSAPTVTVGTNGASFSLASGSVDTAGKINVVTKSSGNVATSSLVHFAFGSSFAVTPKCVLVTATSSGATVPGLYAFNVATSGFDVYTNLAPTASANITFYYLVVQ